jgi:hypothetical protein
VQTFTFFMGGTADRGSQKALVCTLSPQNSLQYWLISVHQGRVSFVSPNSKMHFFAESPGPSPES